MSATHALRTFTEAQDDALLIGRLEAEVATLTEENATLRADNALLKEGSAHLLGQYAEAMERLAAALEWKGNATLAFLAGGFAFVWLVWGAS